MKPDLLIANATELLTCVPAGDDLVGRIPNGSIAVEGERILAVGPAEEVVAQVDGSDTRVIDARGKIVAPGFVDSHTHVVFGGSRVQEYAAKMTRLPAEVKAMGIPTGIVASTMMTRSETVESLTESATERLRGMLQAGTTTVESKSGYGLDLVHELKMLEVNGLLQKALPLDVISTFMGAHAFLPGVGHERYVDEVIHEMIPAVSEEWLVEFCDVYPDEGYFSLDQSRRILEAARDAGLKLKIHADQYSTLGGTELAAEMAVVSADHLNYTEPPTMHKLAEAGVVGVLMPLIDFAVQHPHPFDARAMMDAGMTLALATDICPGGWTESMQLVMQFACRQHRFTPEEALYAATVGGANALARNDRGTLSPDMLADIQIWDLPTFEDVIYRLGNNAVEMVIKRGKVVVG